MPHQGVLRKLLLVFTLLSLTAALQPPSNRHTNEKKAAERFSARKREQTKRHYDQLTHAHGFDKRQAYSNTTYRFLTEESARKYSIRTHSIIRLTLLQLMW